METKSESLRRLTPELREKIEKALIEEECRDMVFNGADFHMKALADAARLLLALVPADDGEKIDGAFLESVGFAKWPHGNRWDIGVASITPSLPILLSVTEAYGGGWIAAVRDIPDADGDTFGIVELPCIPLRPARGEIRRLCAALSIPLPPASGLKPATHADA